MQNMARGSAIEAGLEKYLTDDFGCTIAEAVEFAREEFLKETALVVDKEAREKELADGSRVHRTGGRSLCAVWQANRNADKNRIRHWRRSASDRL